MTILIGDIGGTNARFALANQDAIAFSHEQTLQCADFPNAIEAITHYLKTIDVKSPDIICLAAAGPVVNQTIQLTNNSWAITAAELQEQFSSRRTHLLNDFEAIAYSMPHLQPHDLMGIGYADRLKPNHNYTIGVVGAGTGLGAAGILENNGVTHPLLTEAGHTSFAPNSTLQHELLLALKKMYQPVSNERLISGPGIMNIYNALCDIHDTPSEPLSTAEIFSAHLASKNDIASKTIHVFYELLGQFAGDFALSIGAFDGIYIAGGVAQRYPDVLTKSNFRKGFENKGRHQEIMMGIPSNLIRHQEPGLLGACAATKNLIGSN